MLVRPFLFLIYTVSILVLSIGGLIGCVDDPVPTPSAIDGTYEGTLTEEGALTISINTYIDFNIDRFFLTRTYDDGSEEPCPIEYEGFFELSEEPLTFQANQVEDSPDEYNVEPVTYELTLIISMMRYKEENITGSVVTQGPCTKFLNGFPNAWDRYFILFSKFTNTDPKPCARMNRFEELNAPYPIELTEENSVLLIKQ